MIDDEIKWMKNLVSLKFLLRKKFASPILLISLCLAFRRVYVSCEVCKVHVLYLCIHSFHNALIGSINYFL